MFDTIAQNSDNKNATKIFENKKNESE